MKLVVELFLALVGLVVVAVVMAIVVPAWIVGAVIVALLEWIAQWCAGPLPADPITTREGPDDWQ